MTTTPPTLEESPLQKFLIRGLNHFRSADEYQWQMNFKERWTWWKRGTGEVCQTDILASFYLS